jgi:hypothetical protein
MHGLAAAACPVHMQIKQTKDKFEVAYLTSELWRMGCVFEIRSAPWLHLQQLLL